MFESSRGWFEAVKAILKTNGTLQQLTETHVLGLFCKCKRFVDVSKKG